MNIEKEIETLKNEAVDLMCCNGNHTEESEREANRRIVGCIVSAAILEVANIQSKVFKDTP